MLKKIIFLIIIILSPLVIVKADCSEEELKQLKDEAKNIKITYKHLGAVDTEEGVYYNSFNLKIKNIPDDFYVILDGLDIKYIPENNIVEETFDNGQWSFSFYSNKCTQKISTISVKIPRFNIYSLNKLCEGIDGNDFALCGKYYDYDVSYESFKARVENYRRTHKINDKKEEIKEETKVLDKIIKTITTFIKKYLLYIAIGVPLLIISIITIIIITKKRKKRRVLQ